MSKDKNEKSVPVKSFVRVKPQNREFLINKNTIEILSTTNTASEFAFDKVFGPHSTTEDIFLELLPVIDRIMDSSITILAYGQTGSGKTYTMSGEEGFPGLIQMILARLLKAFEIRISFIEIYNEKILDLLDNVEKQLRECSGKVFVQDLSSRSLSSLEEFNRFSEIILKNRKTGETKLNKASSRSHLIVRMQVGEKVINLVDLAGSENNRKTGNEGERMKESLNINKSLFVLNKVVHSIINKEPRIPYRDSKLTRLLQESIGGEGECYIIATVIDRMDEVGETLNTLSFAAKSKKILNSRDVCIDKDGKADALGLLHKGTRPDLSSKKIPKKSICKRKFMPASSPPNVQQGLLSATREAATKTLDSHFVLPGDSVRSTPATCMEKLASGNTSALSSGMEVGETKRHHFPSEQITNEDPPLKISKATKHDSSSTLKAPFGSKSIEMTPITKKKSTDCFLARAGEYEGVLDYKSALEIYKTVHKFAPSEFVKFKIQLLQKSKKKEIQKFPHSRVLEILNSGSFIDVKKLNGVGDKRAQIIVDFVSGGHFFESVGDLKLLFNEKIVQNILGCIE